MICWIPATVSREVKHRKTVCLKLRNSMFLKLMSAASSVARSLTKISHLSQIGEKLSLVKISGKSKWKRKNSLENLCHLSISMLQEKNSFHLIAESLFPNVPTNRSKILKWAKSWGILMSISTKARVQAMVRLNTFANTKPAPRLSCNQAIC